MSQPGGIPAARTHCWVTVPLTLRAGTQPPSAGRVGTLKRAPTPSPVPWRWEPGCGAGRRDCSEKLSSGGLWACAMLCSLFRTLVSHPWSGRRRGAGSPRPPPVPAQRPSPPGLWVFCSQGLSISRACSWYPQCISFAPWGPRRSPAWAPPPSCPGLQEGQVKALSRKNEAEQSEEQGQQPEQAGQRGRAQSLPPAGRPVPQETQPQVVPTNPPDRLAATSLLPAA